MARKRGAYAQFKRDQNPRYTGRPATRPSSRYGGDPHGLTQTHWLWGVVILVGIAWFVIQIVT